MFPSITRLSTDHVLFTIMKRDNENFNKNLNLILGGRFDIKILNIIGNFLCSNVDITIRDLASKSGTYIPKKRSLGI